MRRKHRPGRCAVVAADRNLGRAPESRALRPDVDEAPARLRHLDLRVRFRTSGPCGQASCGPRGFGAHILEEGLMRSWVRTGSRGIIASARMKALAFHSRSTKIPLRSTRLTRRRPTARPSPLLLDNLRALGLAHLLHDDLLGVCAAMRRTPPTRRRLDETADLAWHHVERVLETQLFLGKLEFGRVVAKTFQRGTCRSRLSCG